MEGSHKAGYYLDDDFSGASELDLDDLINNAGAWPSTGFAGEDDYLYETLSQPASSAFNESEFANELAFTQVDRQFGDSEIDSDVGVVVDKEGIKLELLSHLSSTPNEPDQEVSVEVETEGAHNMVNEDDAAGLNTNANADAGQPQPNQKQSDKILIIQGISLDLGDNMEGV